MRSRLAALVAIAALLPAFAVQAQRRGDSDLLLRVNGPVSLAAGDSASTLVAVGGDADVAGFVRDQLVVVNGRARVTGTVRDGITVFNGTVVLAPTARVLGDVYVSHGTVVREPGSIVEGLVQERAAPAFGVFAFAVWLSITFTMLVFGALFVAAARTPLVAAAQTLRRETGAAALTSVFALVSAVVLAMAGFASLIGIPLGFALLFLVLPAVGFIGYVVAAIALGGTLLQRVWNRLADEHPYRAVLLGLLVLQVAGLIPVLGGIVVLAATGLGAGSIVYRAWRNWRDRPRMSPMLAPLP